MFHSWGRFLLCLALVSCGQAPQPPSTQPVVVTIASAAPSAAPRPSVSAAPTAEAPPPPPEPSDDEPSPHKVSLTLEPGKPPCTLVLEGDLFQDHPEWFVITSVSRMATEESGGCQAGVLYDLSKETKAHPDDMDPEALTAGIFRKPGQTLPADVSDGPLWNLTEDLNFDGVMDLCVVVMTGAYNYSQQCWLFDTKSRTFARHRALDELIFVEVDQKKKKLKSSFRAGGPVYENNEYEWQKGKLVKTYQSVSYFGETPDGKPLSAGFSHWIIRRELRNGKWVKTFEGPMKDTP